MFGFHCLPPNNGHNTKKKKKYLLIYVLLVSTERNEKPKRKYVHTVLRYYTCLVFFFSHIHNRIRIQVLRCREMK